MKTEQLKFDSFVIICVENWERKGSENSAEEGDGLVRVTMHIFPENHIFHLEVPCNAHC